MVILNKDLIRSKRCKKKHKGHCTWMHSGRVWNAIYEFMEYSGYSFLTVYELQKKGILTIKDRKESKKKTIESTNAVSIDRNIAVPCLTGLFSPLELGL